MDPQASLHDLLDALSRGDKDESSELIDGLSQWIQKGGWLPNVIHSNGSWHVNRKPFSGDVDSVVRQLSSSGENADVISSALSDSVTAICEADSSSINNAGHEAQVKFLLANGASVSSIVGLLN